MLTRLRYLFLGVAMLALSSCVSASTSSAARVVAGAERVAGGTVASPALPDTGLFAPVARQYRARLDRLRDLAAGALTPERVRMLLATGQVDEAARLAAALTGDPSSVTVARGRALLARQEFAALAPLVAGISPASSEGERGVLYAWLVARDDAPRIDSLTRGVDRTPELLAAGRLAYDMLDYPRAESLLTRALASTPAPERKAPAWGSDRDTQRAVALTGLGLVQQKRREWDESLTTLTQALDTAASSDVLMALTETLIRLGRTADAISAAEWAVQLNPYHEAAHYLLGNGYARRNYSQLAAAYPTAFADSAGRAALARADTLLGSGRRVDARAAYGGLVQAHPGWADARVRLASLDFEEGRFVEARDGCFAALRICPGYGRAHAVLAKALEGQRFVVDVHRADYETRFAAASLPDVPGMERLVVNWRALTPRHQKRVALSLAPWKAFVPVLVDGGATIFIKPMYMLLSDCPDQQTLRDQRINYDSRLWDDVRGAGGYHTVTGIEDVERTIFNRYNTVLHELTHQVHGVLPADDQRIIQEHYRRAKERDGATREGFLSRYAGGSVWEYFAEGANALASPMRDAYDPGEIVRERLDHRDPDLRRLIEGLEARTDVSASYPVALVGGGDDRVERGLVNDALPFYHRALALSPTEETALVSLARTLVVGNRGAEAESAAARAVAAHPESGPARVGLAEAAWHAGRDLAGVRGALQAARAGVRAEDRYQVDLELGSLAWVAGDAPQAIAAYDSVLAYQSDSPEGMQGRAAALALARRWEDAFPLYEQAVRVRTGVVGLRCDYARDLLRAGRPEAARTQLDEAGLLDAKDPTAEALRAWVELATGRLEAAREHAENAVAWGPWCDLAYMLTGAVDRRAGREEAARAAWAPLEERLARHAPPEYVYRPELATWEEAHILSATDREILGAFQRQ
jgi:tetratricopeptide (TPR) repeat protein